MVNEDKITATRLPREQREALERIAEANIVPLSTVLRWAVTSYLEAALPQPGAQILREYSEAS